MIHSENPVSPSKAARPVKCPKCQWAGVLGQCGVYFYGAVTCPQCDGCVQWATPAKAEPVRGTLGVPFIPREAGPGEEAVRFMMTDEEKVEEETRWADATSTTTASPEEIRSAVESAARHIDRDIRRQRDAEYRRVRDLIVGNDQTDKWRCRPKDIVRVLEGLRHGRPTEEVLIDLVGYLPEWFEVQALFVQQRATESSVQTQPKPAAPSVAYFYNEPIPPDPAVVQAARDAAERYAMPKPAMSIDWHHSPATGDAIRGVTTELLGRKHEIMQRLAIKYRNEIMLGRMELAEDSDFGCGVIHASRLGEQARKVEWHCYKLANSLVFLEGQPGADQAENTRQHALVVSWIASPPPDIQADLRALRDRAEAEAGCASEPCRSSAEYVPLTFDWHTLPAATDVMAAMTTAAVAAAQNIPAEPECDVPVVVEGR